MRVVFAGTPAFAAAALKALGDSGIDVALVLTQPDRAAGRGMKESISEVKKLALLKKYDIFQPPSLKDVDAQMRLRAAGADIMIVAAYGLILPKAVLELFPAGCLNIHASLLPRWRGAAPIQRAILAGDKETGVSIMRMEEGLDTGPVYLARTLHLDKQDTAGSLNDKLAALGARTLVEVLPSILSGTLKAVAQPPSGVTYAHKFSRAEAEMQWTNDARQLERQIRAFNPHPGAYSLLAGESLKIWQADLLPDHHPEPGIVTRVSPEGIDVACGSGSLRITEIQRAGGKRLAAADFLRGSPLAVGARFGV
jgi:methionyl-tRNA formyltransferase